MAGRQRSAHAQDSRQAGQNPRGRSKQPGRSHDVRRAGDPGGPQREPGEAGLQEARGPGAPEVQGQGAEGGGRLGVGVLGRRVPHGLGLGRDGRARGGAQKGDCVSLI